MRGALFAGIVCVAGCSLLVPLDASSGGDDPDGGAASDAPNGDDGANGTADGAPNGSLDGSADAALDAALVCPPNPIVCDRFERATPAGDGWQAVDGVELSTTRSFSPTRSLRLHVETGDDRHPHLQRFIENPPAQLHVTFRLWLGAPPAEYFELVKIPYGGLNQWDTATVDLDELGLRTGMQTYTGSSSPADSNEDPVTDTSIFDSSWHFVDMTIDMRAMTKLVTVSVDGKTPVTVQIVGHATVQKPAEVTVGILYRGGAAGLSEFYVDDFVITAL